MAFSSLDSKLTGPLFRSEDMAELFSDRARIAAMLMCEEALARVQARFGLVPDALAPAIAAIEPGALDLDKIGRETALAGVPVIPFVKAVQKLLPRDLEPFFHFGATTQDIADSALALQMRAGLLRLAHDLAGTIDALGSLASTFRETPCIGRTYLQHAAPVTFGFKIAARLSGLVQVATRLPGLVHSALYATLGGPVGTLAALGDKGPAVARAFALELNLAASPLPLHTQRASPVELAAWLAELCGALGALGADFAHLASTEVGEVSEPYIPGRGGSSAMPHKRNPVSATVLVAAAMAAPGLAATMTASMVALHERPAGAWHAEWHALPQLFGLASGALVEARRVAEGLSVHAERMRANIDLTRGLIFADAVSAALAPTRGRGEAHALVERAADAVRSQHIMLDEAILAADLTPAERDAVAQACRLEPAIAAAAQWVVPAVQQARVVHAALIALVKDH